ncbi:hypothetical protein EV363DRAFT_171738 [Boletus edulis]|nr:hypothetical protein EV363DRAFT_171738 [Boletus edulis]
MMPTRTQTRIRTRSMTSRFIPTSLPRPFLWHRPVNLAQMTPSGRLTRTTRVTQLDADELGAGDEAAVHPFARALEAGVGEGDGFDDSFDSESGYEGQGDNASAATEETVFGIPPARRGQQGREPGQLKLLGEDLLQDTIGIGGQLAKTGRIEESPTPYGRG